MSDAHSVATPTDELRAIASECGLPVEYVKGILLLHRKFEQEQSRLEQRSRRHLGQIDVRGIPFLQMPANQLVGSPMMTTVTTLVTGLAPFSGSIEAYYGADFVTGRRLPGLERFILLALDLVPVARTLVAAGARGVHSATLTARLSMTLGLHPRALLPILARLRSIAERSRRVLRSAYVKLARGGGSASLSEAERLAVKEVVEVVPGMAASGVVASRVRTGAVRAGRSLAVADAARLRDLHPALPRYLDFHERFALDRATERGLALLFRRTGGASASDVARRSSSGEFAVLEKLHNSPSTRKIHVVTPSNRKGDVLPDFRVESVHGPYHVEVTTPTLAFRGQVAQRGVARVGKKSISRPATSTEIMNAFLRKIKKGQITPHRPGVIVVNVQRVPSSGPVLTAAQVRTIESALADRPQIRELLIVVPGARARHILRVGSRDSGLDLAEGVLRTAP